MKPNNRARNLFVGTAVASLLLITTSAWAQTTAATAGRSGKDLGTNILYTLIFGSIGIVLAIIGFKLFDVVIKHNIETEIFDNKNMAAAMLAGAVVLGVSLIVAATILSP
jgi:putative membrane protein